MISEERVLGEYGGVEDGGGGSLGVMVVGSVDGGGSGVDEGVLPFCCIDGGAVSGSCRIYRDLRVMVSSRFLFSSSSSLLIPASTDELLDLVFSAVRSPYIAVWLSGTNSPKTSLPTFAPPSFFSGTTTTSSSLPQAVNFCPFHPRHSSSLAATCTTQHRVPAAFASHHS